PRIGRVIELAANQRTEERGSVPIGDVWRFGDVVHVKPPSSRAYARDLGGRVVRSSRHCAEPPARPGPSPKPALSGAEGLGMPAFFFPSSCLRARGKRIFTHASSLMPHALPHVLPALRTFVRPI